MNHRRKVFGFSLVEVLVSLCILSVGIIGVLGAFSLGVRSSSRAVRVDKAAAIAEFEVARAAVSISPVSLPGKGKSGIFQWSRTVSTLGNDLYRVSVMVSWTQQGREEKFELSQIFQSQGNIQDEFDVSEAP